MKEVLLLLILGFLLALVHSYDRQRQKNACEGSVLNLDCPRYDQLEILSANFGRTNEHICTSPNQTMDEINCVSKAAKKIIFKKCDKKTFCSVKASSSELGGDPCPGVRKYIDVIFKCVRVLIIKGPIAKPTQSLPTENSTAATAVSTSSTTDQVEIPTTIVDMFEGNMIKPNETNVKASTKQAEHGFFHSMLVLLVLLKDKPKHSLLSVLTGVAAGTVIVLITVLVCVCVDKRRRKNESGSFGDSDAKKGEVIELEKSELLSKKKGSNSDSARTDDQVDSAFSDDDVDRRASNEYVAASDMAYLDAYLDEYNKNHSLPRPPGTDRRDSGAQRMSRRAHNDGSKGRSYDYNSNNENMYTTFS